MNHKLKQATKGKQIMKTYTTKANAKRAAKAAGLDLNTTCIFEQDGLWVIGQVDLFDEAEADAEYAALQARQKEMAEAAIAASQAWLEKYIPYNPQMLLTYTPAKAPRIEDVKESEVKNPVKLVWEIADRMWGERRTDIIKACVEAGIAYNTARTQYQAFYSVKSKENKKADKTA